MDYSIIETKKIVSKIIIDSINKEIINDIDSNNMFLIVKDSNDKIETIDIDSKYINYILNKVTTIIDENLNSLENKDSIFKLPLFNNNILSNIFPRIPVRIDIIGNTLCVINTNVESYGINNALFKVNIDITIDIRILLPFVSEITTISTNIPIVTKLITGEIPGYYFGDYFNKSYSN